MLGQRLCEALLDSFVLRPQQHLVVLGVLFDFCPTGRDRVLYGCRVGFLLGIAAEFAGSVVALFKRST